VKFEEMIEADEGSLVSTIHNQTYRRSEHSIIYISSMSQWPARLDITRIQWTGRTRSLGCSLSVDTWYCEVHHFKKCYTDRLL